jgi:hypothetical protein
MVFEVCRRRRGLITSQSAMIPKTLRKKPSRMAISLARMKSLKFSVIAPPQWLTAAFGHWLEWLRTFKHSLDLRYLP